jgi:hypothetical protein
VPSRRAFLAAIGSAGGVALAGCLGRESVSGSWPRPGFDPAQTGHAPDVTGPASTPTTRWTARFPDRGVHTVAPALVDDAVLVASEAPAGDGTAVILRRFDATDGTATLTTTVTRYDDRTSSAVLWNSLVADDRGLYLVAFDGVHALTRDGERRWHRPLGGGPATSIQSKAHPLVDDDTVYVPTGGTTSRTGGDEALYALDAADGTERWRHQPDADDFGWTFPPATADGTCYFSALEHAVTAHDPATGEVLWETRLPANGPPTGECSSASRATVSSGHTSSRSTPRRARSAGGRPAAGRGSAGPSGWPTVGSTTASTSPNWSPATRRPATRCGDGPTSPPCRVPSRP